MSSPFPITVALDWTPNVNHVGFYMAQALDLYTSAGVTVTLLSPAADEYSSTPAHRVARGLADYGVAPSESVIAYHDCDPGAGKPELCAVAALSQVDTSAIVTLESRGITRPREMDGSVKYASYGARYEDALVRSMIRRDGGDGAVQVVYPPKLGVWDTLLSGAADATWVFMPWEGVLAANAGVILRPFRLEEYGVPYGYTPVLLARPEVLASPHAKAFLAATAQGYEYAVAHQEEAADVLATVVPREVMDVAALRQSLRELAPSLLQAGTGKWGRMDAGRWEAFVAWLATEGLLGTGRVEASRLFTNALLP